LRTKVTQTQRFQTESPTSSQAERRERTMPYAFS
jgi:hypothetical protein